MHRQKHIADIADLGGDKGEQNADSHKHRRKYEVINVFIFHINYYITLGCNWQVVLL